MSDIYPADSDGDALRKVVDAGADMSRPMVIDFSVDAPDQSVAIRVAELVAPLGFDPDISFDDDSKSWSVYCGKSMLATYDGVVSVQAELNALLGPLGANCDGWVPLEIRNNCSLRNHLTIGSSDRGAHLR
jgi:hypothetical protein